MQRPAAKVLIISAQTPRTQSPIKGVAPGNSGLYMQQVAKGGHLTLHHDFRIEESEREIFSKHLQSGSWLVLTGHGNAGLDHVSGSYLPQMDEAKQVNEREQAALDIECSAKNFVNLVMKSNVLREGNMINILLSVCHAAKPGVDQNGSGAATKSFAEQLGDEFALRGIHTCIVASEQEVERIDQYNDDDKPYEKLRFRTDKDAIRIFYRTVNNSAPLVLAAKEDFFITAAGIGCGEQLKSPKQLYDEFKSDHRLLEAILNEDPAINVDVLAKNFNTPNQTEKMKALLLADGGVLIRKSSSSMNTIAVTYIKSLQPFAMSQRQFHCSEDGSGSLKIDEAEIFHQYIRRYSVVVHSTTVDAAKIGLMWKHPAEQHEGASAQKDPRRQPGKK